MSNNNVKTLSIYERILSVLYNKYVRAQIEFTYQIDQLASHVRSIETCNKSVSQQLFSNIQKDIESSVLSVRSKTAG